ncbi:MAG: hypothetical protein IPM32_17095 [Ignavibacteriae bacterium]|nr:hypothetical protein [Ignavibacteriota bacterium]
MLSSEKLKISILLFISFLLFYALQIPNYTSKPDVIVFAIRSLAEKPITDFAYLPQNTLLSGNALPNYHLGHTIILWLVYQIVPLDYSATIWTSGFISSISGALIVVFTFLIWLTLGFNKKKSITIAIVVGLIPSFWEQSVIGEVYALQFLFILLFVFAFIKDHILLSSLFFAYSNLVSPLSGLAFGLIFLKGFDKKIIQKSIIVGTLALIIYGIVYVLIGANLMDLLNPLSTEPEGRGVSYRFIAFVFFIILNFNFFLYHLIKGMIFTLKDIRKISLTLILATIPQILLIFAGATFFIELGSFQLPVFWALAFPLGYYISSVKINKYYFGLALIIAVSLSYTLWIRTNVVVGKEREDAGKWLRINDLNNLTVIGPWSVGVSVIKGRDGSNLNALKNFYIEKSCPKNCDIEKTKKEELIIASAKKIPLRVALSKLKLDGLQIEEYNPIKEITTGTVKKIYENESVTLFKWEK